MSRYPDAGQGVRTGRPDVVRAGQGVRPLTSGRAPDNRPDTVRTVPEYVRTLSGQRVLEVRMSRFVEQYGGSQHWWERS